jgi:hypothetical protein
MKVSRWTWAFVIGIPVFMMAFWLRDLGRPWLPDGPVPIWAGADEVSSQGVADWYSPSHVIHGLLFYALLVRLLPAWRLDERFYLAFWVEALWELVENSPWVIDRYRQSTVSADYAGDTILNSVADLACAGLGFALARRLPVWASVALAVAFELAALAAVRDNLTLNVVMLAWPIEAVRAWQAGG